MNNSKKVWNVIAIIAIVFAVILGINLYNKNTSYAFVFLNDNFFIISSEPLSIFTAINIIK